MLKFKLRGLCLLFLFIISDPNVEAQKRDTLAWYNPVEQGTGLLEGQAWPKENKAYYHRLPARAEGKINPEVWKLSQQSAGLMLRFNTTSNHIIVRYQVGGALAMPHMPATGVSGVDLFTREGSGKALWLAGKYSFKDTIRYDFTDISPNAPREYHLYLPLYNDVKWLQIGVTDGSTFKWLPARAVKPIVVYGTSISQGACASRPGMAWTAILSRKLNIPLINLGFSGTGRLEKEVLNFVNEIDAQVYVLDCLPNLIGGKNTFSHEEIYNRIVNAVKQIRMQHPTTPIVLTDHFGFPDRELNAGKQKLSDDIITINRNAYLALQKQHINNVYLLRTALLKQDTDTMVDGIHPTDLGMMRYADGYLQFLTGQVHIKPER